ncbi:MAG: glycosyltransferase family 9 protein [Alphaproteobacteria bacterium]|nr:glycosyltransferase family 9 protein [Alphaproteobacteria bacterium]
MSTLSRSTAVIQVKRGIGDVIWHLPFIRAIAGAAPERAVTFLTLPSTHAKELLSAEQSVGDVRYFEHQGSELERAMHLARLVGLLRELRPRRVWILDRTVRPALAAALAGVPERIGLGLGAQRLFITNKGIAPHHREAWPVEWLRELMREMNVPLDSVEPQLALPAPLLETVAARHAAQPRPWTILALGGSHPAKDWPEAHWLAFLRLLRRQTRGTIFLIGGAQNSDRAAALIADSEGAATINLCTLGIVEAAALMRLGDIFVGPDSGPMNIAAATGTPAFALFGATPPHLYSRFIHAIEPEGGQSMDGMRRITPQQVMRRIEPYLDLPSPVAR